eukprot:3027040-Pleurochrysis_carterae.AAC.4
MRWLQSPLIVIAATRARVFSKYARREVRSIVKMLRCKPSCMNIIQHGNELCTYYCFARPSSGKALPHGVAVSSANQKTHRLTIS